jgi:uncharacterized membrane protein YagU involved in acid resistance
MKFKRCAWMEAFEMVETIGKTSTFVSKTAAGAAGGLIGGLAFGAMMGMLGMLPMVAGLVGSQDALVGFIVHMVISAFIGATFGLIFGDASRSLGRAALWGGVYGIVWWVLGPLVIMPLMMGMGLQFASALSGPMLMSLMGHLVYGVVAGLGFAWIARRQ